MSTETEKQTVASQPGAASPESAILIAGMHRSGTSALTRVLNLIGYRLADDLLPPNTDNETGFWESKSFIGLHDRALAAMRLRWATPSACDGSWFGSPEAHAFERELGDLLRGRFPGAKPIAIKDPRLCRLLPMWKGVLRDWCVPCSVLIPIRHPVEVAASLKTRGNVPIESGLLLWLWYVLDTERESRDLHRSFLNYSDMLDDWRGVLGRVGSDLGREWSGPMDEAGERVDEFLNPSLRRQRFEGPIHGGTLHGWVSAVYDAVTKVAAGGSLDTDVMDGVWAEVSKADALYGEAIRDAERMTFDAISGTRYHAARVADLAKENNETDRDMDPTTNIDDDRISPPSQGDDAARNALIEIGERVGRLENAALHTLPSEPGPDAAQGSAPAGRDATRESVIKIARGVGRYLPGGGTTPGQMFDARWYASHNPDVRAAVGKSRFSHYRSHGWAEGRWPHPLFDPGFYLAVNPDVAAAGAEPFRHYLEFGWKEGRDPNPLFSVQFYLSHYGDVGGSGIEPLSHYASRGWREGRWPHPLFDPAKARATDPAGDPSTEPLAEYLHGGWARGSTPCDEFDAAFYRQQAPDLPADRDAFTHYAGLGWRRGLDGARWLVSGEFRALCPEAGVVDPLGYVLRYRGEQLERWRAPLGADLRFTPDSSTAWEQDGGAWRKDARLVAPYFGAPIDGVVRPGRPVEFPWIAPRGGAPSISLVCKPCSGYADLISLKVTLLPMSGQNIDAPLGFVIASVSQREGSITWWLSGLGVEPGRRYKVRVEFAACAQGTQVSQGVVLPGWVCDPRAQNTPAMLTGRDNGLGLSGRLSQRFISVQSKPVVLVLGDTAGSATASASAWAASRFPNASIRATDLDNAARVMPLASDADIVVFADDGHPPHSAIDADAISEALNGAGACTVRLRFDAPDAESIGMLDRAAKRARAGQAQADRRCHFTAHVSKSGDEHWTSSLSTDDLGSVPDTITPASLHAAVWGTSLPCVVIVTVLYRKEKVVERFLQSVDRQGYQGPISVVMVDDCSPENDADRAQKYWDQSAESRDETRSLRIISNETNTGNCGSRNRGIAEVDGDIYIVIDCDCLLNKGFVATHVREHLMRDADVVCGPLNIEAGERDPEEVVWLLENEPHRIPGEAGLQDPLQPNGFVNCITRNVSISARFAKPGPLFDEDFAYSAKPGSGFGWEDVEMGASLYKQGAKIVSIDGAFSVHCTHPPSGDDSKLCLGSARNFVRLAEKHDDLPLIARRWMSETAGKIGAWAGGCGANDDSNIARLNDIFARGQAVSAPHLAQRDSGRRLRVLTYRWHAPHQYELYKLPHDFTLATQLGNGMVDVWSHDQRPFRSNARMLPMHDIDPSEYDVAILHFDENVLAVDNCNGVLGHDWGEAFRRALEWDIPKVAICHGTPQFEGQYGFIKDHIPSFNVYESERRQLVDALRGTPVVVNSWQALDEWEFENARVIWHGFDPQEFPPGTYANQVLTHGPDPDRPHYRGQRIYDDVLAKLEGVQVETARHPGAPLLRRASNEFAVKNFRSYVDRIRSFTAYLNTTRRSPMPRSRGEAMMCGVIPVCLRNHDVDHFIRHGVNGFVGDSASELAEYIKHLLANPVDARRIGAQARLTAMDVFNHDRFLSEWCALLNSIARNQDGEA